MVDLPWAEALLMWAWPLFVERHLARCPNVGRSMLIDMDALQQRLRKGDLIAMLDEFERESLELDSPFRSLPNTYLTPMWQEALSNRCIALWVGWSTIWRLS
jgi:hypothetical protein